MSRGAPKVGAPPEKVVFRGVRAGSPEYRQLYADLRGPIDHFFRAASHNRAIGALPTGFAHQKIPEGQLHYSYNNGQEQLVVELNPGVLSRVEQEQPKVEHPWDWVILEMIAHDLSDDGSGAPYRLDTTALRTAPVIRETDATGTIYNPVESAGQKDDALAPPLLAYASSPTPEYAPPAADCITSLEVDLGNILARGDSVVVDLTAVLVGGAVTAPSAWETVPISSSNKRLGALFSVGEVDVLCGTASYDAHTRIDIVSSASLWPWPTSRTSFNYAPVSGLSAVIPFVSNYAYDSGNYPLDAVFSVSASAAPLVPVRTTDAGPHYSYVEILDLDHDSGLPQTIIYHDMTTSNFRTTGGVTYYDVYDRTRTYTFPAPTVLTSSTPVTYSRSLEYRWIAGWGKPPLSEAHFSAGNRRYSQWVEDESTPKFYETGLLDFSTVVDNGASAQAAGTLKIDRYAHTVKVK